MSDDSIDDVVAEAEAKAKAQTQAQPEPPEPPIPGNGDKTLDDFNKQFCVVRDGGKTKVLTFEEHVQQIGQYQHVRHVPSFISFDDFKNFYCNRTVNHNGKFVPIGKWWLEHPNRRQYEGITFEPCGPAIISRRLNLWRGWGVEPAPGDWALMREHIKEVLANSIAASDIYITNWLAWAVQYPDQRAEVALVFRGKRGSGRGTLGNTLIRLFGQHAIHVSHSEHLTGRFNAHLRDTSFLFADEAYWPGDKSAEGSLKALITEPDIMIEPKGREKVMVRNMLHVMMASNDLWVVPAGERERRFGVFDVPDHQLQNEAWFGPIYQQLQNGGYAAMLYDLLHRDLGDFHPRRFPRTTALLDQQSASLDPLEAWWVQLLQTGVLWGANPGMPNTAVSHEYEEEVSNENGGVRTVKRAGLFDQAREISPRLKNVTDHAIGHYLTERKCDNTKKVMRRQGWTFPPLDQCRKEWEQRFPGWRWPSSFDDKGQATSVIEWKAEPP